MAERLRLVEQNEEMFEFAKEAGLRYVTDQEPGITRQRRGKSFIYFYPNATRITDEKVLQRIRSLAIPPAYESVWICPHPKGHIQAVGRDARGRKQYRYHPKWREVRDANKFERMREFGRALPKIRKRLQSDLNEPGLSKTKVLATVIELLDKTLIRVGNEEYARDNGSYGLSTMKERHIKVRGERLKFEFRGKSGVKHSIGIKNKKLADVIRKCQELPGQDLFKYIGKDGERHTISSEDVNEYLVEISGEEFTAKDFRTWAGTVLACIALAELGKSESITECRKTMNRAVESVAKKLGNTPSICRKCYVHPQVLEAYLDGETLRTVKNDAESLLDSEDLHESLGQHEREVLKLLERRNRSKLAKAS